MKARHPKVLKSEASKEFRFASGGFSVCEVVRWLKNGPGVN